MEAEIFPDAPEPGKSSPGGEIWLTLWVFAVAGAVAGLVLLFKTSTLHVETTSPDRVICFFGNELDLPLKVYQMHTGTFPTTEQGVHALISAPESVSKWNGPYITQMPLDAWKRPYQYAYPGTHNGRAKPDVWSLGPDGKNGTADDIGNWES